MYTKCVNILKSFICTSIKPRFTKTVITGLTKWRQNNYLTLLHQSRPERGTNNHYSLMSNSVFQNRILHDRSVLSY